MNYNKLKRAAEKITMPEGMEERIIKKCYEYQKNSGIDDESGYSQQVSGVEKANPRHITRIISAAAACAVIAGSVGAAAHFLKRSTPGTSNHAGEIGETEAKSNHSSETEMKNNPLADFCDHDYSLLYMGNQVDLNEEQKSLFADFFNRCEYGEWTDEDEVKAMTRSYYEAYEFIETNETESTAITIDCNDCLTITRYTGASQTPESAVSEKYKIDYEEFRNTKTRIIEETSNAKIPQFADLHEYYAESVEVLYGEYNQSVKITEEQKSTIADFLINADYADWTAEDEAAAAVSSYPAKEEYHLRFRHSKDPSYQDIKFDITGCFTVTLGELSDDGESPYWSSKYRIDYNIFSNTFKQIMGVDINENSDISSYPFVNFESSIQSGAEIKLYTSDAHPEHYEDQYLTENQCRLLDDYFKKTYSKLEEVDEHVPNKNAVMIFEVNQTFFVLIYSDDYIHIKDDNVQVSRWYKYYGERMYAEIETIFRNGSTIDSSDLYPPFGNLAKCTDTIDVIYYNGSDSNLINMNSESVHQAFYGYNWSLYESEQPNDTSPKHIKFKFCIDASEEIHVTVYADGYVFWKGQGRKTNYIYEEHWYKFPDSDIYQTLLIPFSEKIGTVE